MNVLLILEPSYGKQARLEPKRPGHRRKLELLPQRMAHKRAGTEREISSALFRRSLTEHAG